MSNPLFAGDKKPIRVLVLSGSNNHDWEETTRQLEKIFSEVSLFDLVVTLRPDTLEKDDYEAADVVLSNWNSWPENDLRWPEEAEQALSGFIAEVGGFVTFHAATSALYEWPEFKRFTTGAWTEGRTKHGKKSATRIQVTNNEHPVTRGMADFYIFDELWIDAEINADFMVLGTAKNEKLTREGIPGQPAMMVSEYGKGRIFHTILGHDARAMRNTGFRQLLLRGTEWAATGKVTQHPAQALQPEPANTVYRWLETDSSLALMNQDHVLWQYNFNTKHGRPFFHPVFVGRNEITCVSPDDHIWHLGQWFCWKYIKGVNYWEYHRGPFQSDGITEIKQVEIGTNPDHSAGINLRIFYHPFEGEDVLSEERFIKVYPPRPDGGIQMDYRFVFEAMAEEVELNRTPVLGQENGVSWGGYAGLSVRFNQDFMDAFFLTPWHDNDSINGRGGNWLYMGFTGTDGQRVGTQIMVDPESQREGAAWYSVVSEVQPFYYFSPAYLYYSPVTLKKGEKVQLNYRILHLPGERNASELEQGFQKYLNQ